MRVYTIFDPNCFVWDLDDYERNKPKYYTLLDELIEFIDILEREKEITYLMRPEIIWEITNSFPSKLIDETLNRNDLWDKQTIIYSFLSKQLETSIDYNSQPDEIKSVPELIKEHYNNELKIELKMLMNEMLANEEDVCIVFSIDKICGDIDAIMLLNDHKQRKYKVYKTPNEMQTCFDGTKNCFFPSPKHKEPDGWGTILPKLLEEQCYSLINYAVQDEESSSTALYAYSEACQTYVAFRVTLGKEYHAYPVEPGEVPSKVRRYLESVVKTDLGSRLKFSFFT